MAYEIQHFETDVLSRSQQLPVLVDFWAPWCGPCQVLGPMLERLADQAQGQWALAKVNVDLPQFQQAAAQNGVQGIPAVKLFYQGKVTAQFTGALPEGQVKAWLAQHLPPSGTELLARKAWDEWESGQWQLSQQSLEAYLAKGGVATPRTQVLQARLLLFTDPAQALTSLPNPTLPEVATEAQAVRTLAEALLHPPALPEGATRALLEQGLAALKEGYYAQAAEQWIDALQRDKAYADQLARRLGVALFVTLGAQHPVTRQHRRRFDMSLY